MPPTAEASARTTTATDEQDETTTPETPLPETEDAGSDVYTDDLDEQDAEEQAEDASAEPETEAPTTEGDGETGAASGAVPEASGATPAPEAPVEPPPVAWRANLYGQDAEPIPGALYKPGIGVLVPEAHIGTLTALVARGSKYEEFKRERQSAAKAIEQAVAPVQFEAQALAEVVSQFLSPDFYAQLGLTPDLAEPYIKDLQFRLREKALERREKFGPGGARATTAPTDEATLDPYDAQATIGAEVTDLLQHPDYHGVFSAADVQAIGRRLTALNPFVQDAEGQWYLDREAVKAAVELAAEPRRVALKERQANATRQQVQAVAQRNAKVTGQTTPAARPAAAPKPAAPPSWDGEPWENPALSREEKREAWLKAHS
jgi:hypothetical protein